jgi:hypothetical protein
MRERQSIICVYRPVYCSLNLKLNHKDGLECIKPEVWPNIILIMYYTLKVIV